MKERLNVVAMVLFVPVSAMTMMFALGRIKPAYVDVRITRVKMCVKHPIILSVALMGKQLRLVKELDIGGVLEANRVEMDVNLVSVMNVALEKEIAYQVEQWVGKTGVTLRLPQISGHMTNIVTMGAMKRILPVPLHQAYRIA